MLPVLDFESSSPLYMQVYNYIKTSILQSTLKADEKLPSLRGLAFEAGLSVTTIELAYNQLLVEGYIRSRAKSGFFVNNIGAKSSFDNTDDKNYQPDSLLQLSDVYRDQVFFDPSCFDFIKWKKCINSILNDFPELLLEEGAPQGEPALRGQISKYIYQARGVKCSPDQIIIGAGTQQLMTLLSNILVQNGIKKISFEDPGYKASRSAFIDRGFDVFSIPVSSEGINIEALPVDEKTAVYVSPSNQFPMGFVMPISRRYNLLEWSSSNGSIIIEDDYDSELRYFGKPIPSLKSLEKQSASKNPIILDGAEGQVAEIEEGTETVVYLGSFSSTLFNSIKISYMVLPDSLLNIFKNYSKDYNQTCSKLEQLTLSLYMQKGYYQTNIKKLRSLYSQKVHLASEIILRTMKANVKILNSNSGVHMLLEVDSKKSKEQLCTSAAALGISVLPVSNFTFREMGSPFSKLIFYYTRIPLGEIPRAIEDLNLVWFD
jgi:GntR family transcriptional regulator/MocR family aminotransferase